MSQLEFRGIEITDRPWITEALRKSQFRGCEYTFGNNFVWRRVYGVEIASLGGYYFIRWNLGGGKYRFSFPAGGCDVERGVQLLLDYCNENGIQLMLYANKEITEQIQTLYPQVEVKYNRDGSDYVYLADELSELKGKKFHGKRNHLNRFYENDWSFEPISAANIAECIAMNERWCSENLCECGLSDEEKQSKEDETCIVRCSFKYYEQLNYTGGLIRVNREVQAFCFGEPSADDTFVVHVEKALRDYQGAYTAINREFVKFLGGRYKYINREEDTGAENLRKAKLSYHPVFLEEKFDIFFGGNT